MKQASKAKVEHNATRVANWLLDHRTEFEREGIFEDSLATAVEGVGVEEVRAAIDHLENREDVVRWPQALTAPPRFVVKPGRNWDATRSSLLETRSASGTEPK